MDMPWQIVVCSVNGTLAGLAVHSRLKAREKKAATKEKNKNKNKNSDQDHDEFKTKGGGNK